MQNRHIGEGTYRGRPLPKCEILSSKKWYMTLLSKWIAPQKLKIIHFYAGNLFLTKLVNLITFRAFNGMFFSRLHFGHHFTNSGKSNFSKVQVSFFNNVVNAVVHKSSVWEPSTKYSKEPHFISTQHKVFFIQHSLINLPSRYPNSLLWKVWKVLGERPKPFSYTGGYWPFLKDKISTR